MRLNIEIVYFMLATITYITCKIIAIIQATLFLIYRSSLMLCLFYKVQLLYKHRSVKVANGLTLFRFGLLLILIRFGFNIAHILLINPEVIDGICKANNYRSQIAAWGFIGTDFLIEIYLSINIMRLLMHAKKNGNSYNFDNSFDAVIIWCIIRITIALILNLITAITIMNVASAIHIQTLNVVVCIAMSYSLTYDKDVIRFIRKQIN